MKCFYVEATDTDGDRLWTELVDASDGLALVKHFRSGQMQACLWEISRTRKRQVDALFVRDPVNERLLFTVCIPLDKHDAESFALALATLTNQVRQWQATVLAGSMKSSSSRKTRRQPAAASSPGDIATA